MAHRKLKRGVCLVCGQERTLIAHDSSIITHSRIVERDAQPVQERCPGSRMIVLPLDERRARAGRALEAIAVANRMMDMD